MPYRDRIQAANLLGKYGLGFVKGMPKEELVVYLREMGGALKEEAEEMVGDDAAEALWKRIFDRWKRIGVRPG